MTDFIDVVAEFQASQESIRSINHKSYSRWYIELNKAPFRRLAPKLNKKIVDILSSEPEFVEYPLHRGSNCVVMSVNGSWIAGPAAPPRMLGGGEQRFNGFLAKHDQSGHRL